MKIGVFVEDEAHELLLVPLLRRLADMERVGVEVHTRSARGGAAVALTAARQYARDLAAQTEPFLDVLVVAVDGNCSGYVNRRDEIQRAVGERYAGDVIAAAPDPHVERWYLADPRAPSLALGRDFSAEVPAYKCERKRYKQALVEAFRQVNVEPPVGGIEYGEDIALAMDLDVACRLRDFDRFVTDVRGAFRTRRGSST